MKSIQQRAAEVMARSAVNELGQDPAVIPYLVERNIPRARALAEAGLLKDDDYIERLQEAIRRMELNGYTLAGLFSDGLLNAGDMKHP